MKTLINDVQEVLNQYSICYHEKGIKSNVNAFFRNKNSLISILKKHPKWDDDAMAVILDVTSKRDINRDAAYSCKEQLCNMHESLEDSIFIRDSFRHGLQALLEFPSKLLRENQSAKEILMEQCNFTYIAGQKTSKAVNKLCQQYGVNAHADYDNVFAKMADALNPLSIPRKAVLSVHPCDYLQMSGKQNSWGSCHSLADGNYSGGTLSYMNDAISMIFYTVDPDNEDVRLHNRPKINRTVFCFQNGVLLQSRLYPDDKNASERSLNRQCVQNIFATCLKKPNLWKVSRGARVKSQYINTIVHYLHYADYDEGFNFEISFLKAYKDYPTMVIGHKGFCMNCSGELTHGDGKIVCHKCKQLAKCADCGAVIQSSYAIVINGRAYCENCAISCDHCNRMTPANETQIAHHLASEEISICRECQTTNFFQCCECGEYHVLANRVNIDDKPLCPDCHDAMQNQESEQSNMIFALPMVEQRRAS